MASFAAASLQRCGLPYRQSREEQNRSIYLQLLDGSQPFRVCVQSGLRAGKRTGFTPTPSSIVRNSPVGPCGSGRLLKGAPQITSRGARRDWPGAIAPAEQAMSAAPEHAATLGLATWAYASGGLPARADKIRNQLEKRAQTRYVLLMALRDGLRACR
jgi:hypothetical protein